MRAWASATHVGASLTAACGAPRGLRWARAFQPDSPLLRHLKVRHPGLRIGRTESVFETSMFVTLEQRVSKSRSLAQLAAHGARVGRAYAGTADGSPSSAVFGTRRSHSVRGVPRVRRRAPPCRKASWLRRTHAEASGAVSWPPCARGPPADGRRTTWVALSEAENMRGGAPEDLVLFF